MEEVKQMIDVWLRTRDHEGGHDLAAWLAADRPESIGDITVVNEKGLLVARAGIRTEFISSRRLLAVGMAGILAEAKGVVERSHGTASFRSTTGLASQLWGCILQHLARLSPEEGAWRVNVDVAPKERLTRTILSEDDVYFSVAHPDLDAKVLEQVLTQTTNDLEKKEVWAALKAVADLIPEREGAVVPGEEIRALLQEKLPRRW
jgi:hypothetical protein